MSTTSQPRPTDREIVVALLALHGISPTPEEVDVLADAYPDARADMDALYAMPGVGGAVPVVVFDPRT